MPPVALAREAAARILMSWLAGAAPHLAPTGLAGAAPHLAHLTQKFFLSCLT